MPTQEERLTALEQATRESLVHMRDTDMAVTAMVGVIRSQGQDIKRIFETLEQHTAILDQHTTMLHAHTTLLQSHSVLLKQISDNITTMHDELKEIKSIVAKEGEQP